MMQMVTGEKPAMWGESIVGFGIYHYKYESGREGIFFITGFSPRKQSLTIYIIPGFDKYEDKLKKLGKFKIAKSCLYIKSLKDVSLKTLEKIITDSVKYMKKKYPSAYFFILLFVFGAFIMQHNIDYQSKSKNTRK